MKNNVYINGFASISSLGSTGEEIWNAYQDNEVLFKKRMFNHEKYWVSPVSDEVEKELKLLKAEKKTYRDLDKSVLLAILASRLLINNLKQNEQFSFKNTGVNLGSSRGATGLFEMHHKEFLSSGLLPSQTSPSTTLGNLSSWVAQDIGTTGAVISHSITCSTALHGILNAVAWLTSGMASSFIVGGAEAPLTSFTIAQLVALKLYSTKTKKKACHSLDFHKKANTLVLGEAASVFALSTNSEKSIAKILGLGFANEEIKHSISISADAICFQKSMKMALQDASLTKVDVIIMHAPGTVKGDKAELKAIEKTFSNPPFLTTNKWKIGHTYGASGAMSLEMALLILQHQKCISNPYYANTEIPLEINSVMVNAVGFGGNAVSVIVGKS